MFQVCHKIFDKNVTTNFNSQCMDWFKSTIEHCTNKFILIPEETSIFSWILSTFSTIINYITRDKESTEIDKIVDYSEPSQLSPVQCTKLFANVAHDYLGLVTKYLQTIEKNHLIQGYCWVLIFMIFAFYLFKLIVQKHSNSYKPIKKEEKFEEIPRKFDENTNELSLACHMTEVQLLNVNGPESITFNLNSEQYKKVMEIIKKLDLEMKHKPSNCEAIKSQINK